MVTSTEIELKFYKTAISLLRMNDNVKIRLEVAKTKNIMHLFLLQCNSGLQHRITVWIC